MKIRGSTTNGSDSYSVGRIRCVCHQHTRRLLSGAEGRRPPPAGSARRFPLPSGLRHSASNCPTVPNQLTIVVTGTEIGQEGRIVQHKVGRHPENIKEVPLTLRCENLDFFLHRLAKRDAKLWQRPKRGKCRWLSLEPKHLYQDKATLHSYLPCPAWIPIELLSQNLRPTSDCIVLARG